MTVPLIKAQQPSGVNTEPSVPDKPAVVIVVGAVLSPARFELRRNVRLIELLSCVGGLLPEAKNEINIYRRQPDGETLTALKINLKAIIKHRDTDPIIQPYDIVEVLSKKANEGDCFTPLCFMKVRDKVNRLPLRTIK